MACQIGVIAVYCRVGLRQCALLPKRVASILTFSLGIQGSYIPDRWTVQLNRLGLMGALVDKLMEGMVSQALQELTAMYSTRYAAIQHKTAHDE